jgi:AraC-like DNA-binding protein
MSAGGLPELAWLGSVREVCYPLSRLNPIWVKENLLDSAIPLPSPTVQFPEQHPYCEVTLNLGGPGVQHIGNESQRIDPGTIMLMGPGIPHTAEALAHPCHSITVYILPVLFFDLGPNGDGPKILRRFTARQPIGRRLLQLPPAQLRSTRSILGKMLAEFGQRNFGSELRLRSLLGDLLVSLLRWENTAAGGEDSSELAANWEPIQTALHYLHEHHAEVIYVQQLARTVRMGERQLNGLFRERLGMGCIQYLNSYRVSLAAAMLSTSPLPVTTVAYAVGFETLSHFNTTFRSVMGLSPTGYMRRRVRAGDQAPDGASHPAAAAWAEQAG